MMVLRSMLYVPANNVRMAVKAATESEDAVIFDLEDAVPFAEKETARILSRDLVEIMKQRGIHVFVRVNSLTTGLAMEDLKSAVVAGLTGIILPKAETDSDVTEIDKMLSEIENASGIMHRSIKLIPLIESAKGVVNAFHIASASDRIVALAFGAGDYCRDLGRDIAQVSKDEIELLYARSHIVNISRAAGMQAIDTPFLGLMTDNEGFLREVRLAVQLGFNGKQCIHPSQIEPVNSLFSPAPEEINRARRIVEAFEEAQARGLGVVSFEGRMIDHMSYRQAKDILTTEQTIAARKRLASRSTHVSLLEIFPRR